MMFMLSFIVGAGAIFCSHCGHGPALHGARFCIRCGTALVVCALSSTLTIVGRPPSDERPDHPDYKPQKKAMRIADFFIPSVTCKKRKQDHTPPTSTRKYEKLSCPYCSKTCDGNAALQNHKISKHSREMNAQQPTLYEYSTARAAHIHEALKFGAAPGSCKKYRGKYTQLGLDKDDLICNVALNAASGGGRKVRARCVEDAMNAIRDNEQYHNDSGDDSGGES